jgi:FixJ family two-component response regulator
VVDDDSSACRSLGRLLRAAGFQAVTYLSAQAFLADTKHPEFDCLLLDIQLEGMSGIELGELLASSGSTTPVIFITSHDEPELRERAQRIPGATYLRKTAMGEAVLAAIHRAISRFESTESHEHRDDGARRSSKR